MKLTLDHTQRLNLHALLGAQRADVGSIRAIWAVQDKIALDAEEEKTLAVTREITNGLERVVWNPAVSVAAREFELVDAEVARLKAALATWDSYAAGADRRWLEPLLDVLFSSGSAER
ncbi:MAG: hypothetical protein LAQ69_23865 [Acidobacteriia bacterium]|nr:hypothetical protein [Terriglobia bacterium]